MQYQKQPLYICTTPRRPAKNQKNREHKTWPRNLDLEAFLLTQDEGAKSYDSFLQRFNPTLLEDEDVNLSTVNLTSEPTELHSMKLEEEEANLKSAFVYLSMESNFTPEMFFSYPMELKEEPDSDIYGHVKLTNKCVTHYIIPRTGELFDNNQVWILSLANNTLSNLTSESKLSYSMELGEEANSVKNISSSDITLTPESDDSNSTTTEEETISDSDGKLSLDTISLTSESSGPHSLKVDNELHSDIELSSVGLIHPATTYTPCIADQLRTPLDHNEKRNEIKEINLNIKRAKESCRNTYCNISLVPFPNTEGYRISLRRHFVEFDLDMSTENYMFRSKTHLNELFKASEGSHCTPKRILIQADGGYGKTTLLSKITFDWAQGTLAEDFKGTIPERSYEYVSKGFEIVFMYSLRKMDPKLTLVENILNGFKEDTGISNTLSVKKLFSAVGHKILFLLDGLDEAPGKLSDILMELSLRNETFLSGCTVVVSSRPMKILEQPPCQMDKYIYIKGMTNKSIEEFQRKFFESRGRQEDYIKCIFNTADYISFNEISPLVLVILCCLAIDENIKESENAIDMICRYIGQKCIHRQNLMHTNCEQLLYLLGKACYHLELNKPVPFNKEQIRTFMKTKSGEIFATEYGILDKQIRRFLNTDEEIFTQLYKTLSDRLVNRYLIMANDKGITKPESVTKLAKYCSQKGFKFDIYNLNQEIFVLSSESRSLAVEFPVNESLKALVVGSDNHRSHYPCLNENARKVFTLQLSNPNEVMEFRLKDILERYCSEDYLLTNVLDNLTSVNRLSLTQHLRNSIESFCPHFEISFNSFRGTEWCLKLEATNWSWNSVRCWISTFLVETSAIPINTEMLRKAISKTFVKLLKFSLAKSSSVDENPSEQKSVLGMIWSLTPYFFSSFYNLFKSDHILNGLGNSNTFQFLLENFASYVSKAKLNAPMSLASRSELPRKDHSSFIEYSRRSQFNDLGDVKMSSRFYPKQNGKIAYLIFCLLVDGHLTEFCFSRVLDTLPEALKLIPDVNSLDDLAIVRQLRVKLEVEETFQSSENSSISILRFNSVMKDALCLLKCSSYLENTDPMEPRDLLIRVFTVLRAKSEEFEDFEISISSPSFQIRKGDSLDVLDCFPSNWGQCEITLSVFLKE